MPRVRQRVRQITRTLGIVGVAFVIALALALLFYFTGHGALLALDILALIPLGAIMAFRGFRFAQRNMLWSLRNRLLFVYGLLGCPRLIESVLNVPVSYMVTRAFIGTCVAYGRSYNIER